MGNNLITIYLDFPTQKKLNLLYKKNCSKIILEQFLIDIKYFYLVLLHGELSKGIFHCGFQRRTSFLIGKTKKSESIAAV